MALDFGNFGFNFGFGSPSTTGQPALPQMNTTPVRTPLISPITGTDTGNIPMTMGAQPPVAGAMSPLIGGAMDRMLGKSGKAGSLSWVGPKINEAGHQARMKAAKPTSAAEAIAAGATPNIDGSKRYTNVDLPPVRTMP